MELACLNWGGNTGEVSPSCKIFLQIPLDTALGESCFLVENTFFMLSIASSFLTKIPSDGATKIDKVSKVFQNVAKFHKIQ
jgi:hypothetical protein